MKFDFLSEIEKLQFIKKASTLVEALPYIRKHSGKNIVIKYGGHAMGDDKLAQNFSKDIGLLKEIGVNPIIVHGGGPQIEEKLKKRNIKSKFIEGLRITNKESMEIVKDVLSKEINEKIVSDINLTGGKAQGLSGHQNNLIKVKKLDIKIKDSDSTTEKILDLGFVGEPKEILTSIIEEVIAKDYIPVIAPLGIDKNNNTYNINADTAAGAIAGAMKVSKLLLLTDVKGILDKDNKLISSLSFLEANKIIEEKFIHGGMRPKIKTCINAINEGVKEATILDGRIPHSIILELFTEHGIGTQIYS